MKTCSKCGSRRSASGFYSNNRTKDGLRSECRDCSKNMTKRNRLRKKGIKAQGPGLDAVMAEINNLMDGIAKVKGLIGQLKAAG